MAPPQQQAMTKLPKWAKLIQPKKEPTEIIAPPTTNSQQQEKQSKADKEKREKQKYFIILQEEEMYMRKRCYHILAKEMEQTLHQIQCETLKPCLDKLQDCLDAATPHHSPPHHHDHKRQKLFSEEEEVQTSSSTTASPRHSNTDDNTKFVLNGFNSNLFDQQQDINTPHDPLLLPIMLLQDGPSYGIDRQNIRYILQQMLQSARPCSAVVMVEKSWSSGTTTTTSTSSFHWMQELIKQCHRKYPILSSTSNNMNLKRRIIKRKKKRACTFSDMLLLWAQHVTCYDEIVIFLNADDSFYSAEIQDFLHILAARRSELGVPLNIVMMAPHEGRRTMELRPSWQGYAGFRITSIRLPSQQQILEQFWKRLWVDQKFPLIFPSSVLKTIEQSFSHHQASIHCVLLKFQQVLAHYFNQRGTYLTVTSNPKIMSELWQRIAWFIVSSEARGVPIGEMDTDMTSARMLQALEELETRQQTSQLVIQLMYSIAGASNKTQQHHLQQQQLQLFHPTCARSLQHLKRKDVLEHLLKMRDEITTIKMDHCIDNIADRDEMSQPVIVGSRALLSKYVKCSSAKNAAQDLIGFEKQQLEEKQKLINELIILVGKCRDGDTLSEIEQYLDQILSRWIYHRNASDATPLSQEDVSSAVNFQWNWSSDPPEYDWVSTGESLSPQPRSDTLKALLRSAPNTTSGGNHLSLANIAGTMYRLIQDRVATTQEDWYEEFWQKSILWYGVEENYTRERSFALFSLGLRYLKQCGLISEKLRVGSRNDLIYERAKLVWCGVQ